jgi:UDP-N-acetylglucosamine/UDP-N-acetylgalactosamine diphosphorylase
MTIPPSVIARLDDCGQSHVLAFWDELTDDRRQSLLAQIETLDFDQLSVLLDAHASRKSSDTDEIAAQRASRALPPADTFRLPHHGGDPRLWSEAEQAGRDLLNAGRVGAILVAGGVGTRLGSDLPKGMFPLGPVSRRPLFRWHCEQVLACAREAGRPVPYFVMTSDATHADTVRFFRQHACFGLPADDVYFFQQGSLPLLEDAAPRILMEARDRISTSPDGHGGLLRALTRAGLLEVMERRGIEHVYYHQVDNPAAVICDPAFLGLHTLHGSEMSTKVVAKTAPEERVGVVVAIDGRTAIIEYSELPPDLARATGPGGGLRLWAGNTGIHAFTREFLERLAADPLGIPFHATPKAVPCVDRSGALITPTAANARKFDQYIFDALPHARRALVVEADRPREFLPIKNAAGPDSPDTAREGLLRLHREWLLAAGAHVASGVRVEISPLFARSPAELAARLNRSRPFDTDTVLE